MKLAGIWVRRPLVWLDPWLSCAFRLGVGDDEVETLAA